MSTILFIGRFQPSHNGHLKDIKDYSRLANNIIITIAARNKSRERNNPFTYKERKKLINKTLKSNNIINFKIRGIKDYYSDELWLHKIKEIDFDSVITGNKKTKKLLENIGKEVIDAEIIKNISASKIRENIRKNKDYKTMIPKEIYKFLEKKGRTIIIKSS